MELMTYKFTAEQYQLMAKLAFSILKLESS